MTSPPVRVVATQDLDCVDRAKFRYVLGAPVSPSLLDVFGHCQVRVSAFSRFSPLARDLFTILRPGGFRCDGIVGSDELIVTFEGEAAEWPVTTMREFDGRLAKAGCGATEYRRSADLGCATCNAGFHKHCRATVALTSLSSRT